RSRRPPSYRSISSFMPAGMASAFQLGCCFCRRALAAAMSTTHRSSRTRPGNVRPLRSNVPSLKGVSASAEERPTEKTATAAKAVSMRIGRTPFDRQACRRRDLDAFLQLRARAQRFPASVVDDTVERVLVHRVPLRPFVEPDVVAGKVEYPAATGEVEVQAVPESRRPLERDEEPSTVPHGAELHAVAPAVHVAALRLPHRVEQQRAGPVPVSVPALDRPVRPLEGDERPDLALDPVPRLRHRLARIQVERALDRVGVAVLAAVLPVVAAVA